MVWKILLKNIVISNWHWLSNCVTLISEKIESEEYNDI